MVYFCSGTESEKLEWFKTINIAGEKLTNKNCETQFIQVLGFQMQKNILVKVVVLLINIGGDYLTVQQLDKNI
jgi:hypothetical protein